MEDGYGVMRDEIERLKKENADLQREVDILKSRNGAFVKAMANGNSGEIEWLCASMTQELKEKLVVAEEKALKTNELEEKIRDLEETLSIVTKGLNWKEAVNQNVLKSYRVTAHILCYAVKGYPAGRIAEEFHAEVAERTVYRAISVREDTDFKRITTILHQFPEIFDSHGVKEPEVLEWFQTQRIKKLKLLSENDVIEGYGRDMLSHIQPDTFVPGYYHRKDAEAYKEEPAPSESEW